MFYPSIDPSIVYHTRGWMDDWLRIKKKKKIRKKITKGHFPNMDQSLTVALSIVLHHSTTTSSSSRLLHLLHLKKFSQKVNNFSQNPLA